MIALGILDRINGRALYITGAMIFVFWIAFLMAWVKMQIIHNSMELLDNLRRMTNG